MRIEKEDSHFVAKTLNEYIDNKITLKQRTEIEEHIYTCDKCMNMYLNLLEEQIENSGKWEAYEPSKDFSKRVFADIHRAEKSKERKSKSILKDKVVVCYLIAASISLFLIWSGYLQSIRETTALMSVSWTKHIEKAMDGWSEKIIDLSNFINHEERENEN